MSPRKSAPVRSFKFNTSLWFPRPREVSEPRVQLTVKSNEEPNEVSSPDDHRNLNLSSERDLTFWQPQAGMQSPTRYD